MFRTIQNCLFACALIFSLLVACKKEKVEEITAFTPVPTSDIVMYEVNIPAMSTTRDINGVIARLDIIKELGINTIWLMPIFELGELNAFGSPYCIKDYKAVNPELGTFADLQLLVEEAHARGIAVILDWVANHTSWDNAWITNDGWYSEDASGNIISPLGTTWYDVADLNFTNADMRLAMIDAMQYWIDNANIDGFRCDAADYVPFDFWQQAITSLNENTERDLILLAEGARADHFTAGFELNFSWSMLGTLKNVFTGGGYVSTIFSTNTAEYISVPDGSKKLRFTTNHDETNIAPPATAYGSQDAALAAAVIAFYLQGVPLVYCGQEVGISSASAYNGALNWTINPDIYQTYKDLLKNYNTYSALRYALPETFSTATVAIFKKQLNDENMVVIVNTRNSNQNAPVDATLQGEYEDVMNANTLILDDNITLSPYQFYILKRK
ncbi:MAG TPA: alpha-amylase family glycosyl hydrolase [Chitinophagales bacterium]|nr:alpha-amylase family glycosyl hydrolase [Chitinophagales bacterium]HRG28454.1 alpha-amylase family glycosyl hydrolase [Chitinophagales bacterium]HRG86513.1 alpha-amylase family glycosyl hydrolase [Chitinophagales bacterium]HRH53177.1 alpha-amylase family glycosyl hydrolase [Chitinophagales bacterium]